MKKFIPLFLLICICVACSDKPTSPYVILKVSKATGGAKMDVQLYGRLSKSQMVAIASKVKKDSSQYENLQIDYLLPGNSFKNVGGITVYATAAYHETRKLTATDTVTDLHDNKLSFEFVGFTPEEAKKLLSLDPQDMGGKAILGKFVDDFTKTISIVYKDSKNENQIYILELNPEGKIVSATEPLEVTHNGVQKLIISPKGDYCTLIDDMLTMYSIDDPERPYRSLKAGI
jgi:hypothetical protein